jgi:hypothetical protein
MRGIKTPFEVDFISSSDEESGVVVPIPAAPLAGKIFCPNEKEKEEYIKARKSSCAFFIKNFCSKLLYFPAVVNHINT